MRKILPLTKAIIFSLHSLRFQYPYSRNLRENLSSLLFRFLQLNEVWNIPLIGRYRVTWPPSRSMVEMIWVIIIWHIERGMKKISAETCTKLRFTTIRRCSRITSKVTTIILMMFHTVSPTCLLLAETSTPIHHVQCKTTACPLRRGHTPRSLRIRTDFPTTCPG